jgi:hypothetical protein
MTIIEKSESQNRDEKIFVLAFFVFIVFRKQDSNMLWRKDL